MGRPVCLLQAAHPGMTRERGGAAPNSYAECVLSTAGSDRRWGRDEAKVHLESGQETARCSASRSHRVDGCAQGLRPGGAAAQG